MATVRTLHRSDAHAVVERIVRRLDDDALVQPLVNARLDQDALYETILRATNATWVATDESGIVGHLYAAVLGDVTQALAAWTGPDGASFDGDEVLAELVEIAGASWRHAGAISHYVWTLDDDERIGPWRRLGYTPLSVRGVMRLVEHDQHALAPGLVLRAAVPSDIERILELDLVIDLAQGEPGAPSRKDRNATRREMLALLEDPEVNHYVVEGEGRVLAQTITFPLPLRRGSFDHTLHLSEVVVDPTAQGQGIAHAMIDTVLENARRQGFEYVEAQWRVTNDQASSFWPRYGLAPTYVRLGHALDLGK
jgi:ribosomal protein S18 acetylase RimI-like enzyme